MSEQHVETVEEFNMRMQDTLDVMDDVESIKLNSLMLMRLKNPLISWIGERAFHQRKLVDALTLTSAILGREIKA